MCLMESYNSQGSLRKCNHLCKRGKRLPVFLQNREKSPNWMCLTARSVGRGRLLLVSPYSAVPGFIRPFTSTQTNLGQNVLRGTDGIFWNSFLGSVAAGMPNQTQIHLFLKQGFSRTSDTVSAQVCFGEFCFSLASAIPHVWQAQTVTTLAAFIQLRPLKLQSMQSVFPFMSPWWL